MLDEYTVWAVSRSVVPGIVGGLRFLIARSCPPGLRRRRPVIGIAGIWSVRRSHGIAVVAPVTTCRSAKAAGRRRMCEAVGVAVRGGGPHG